MLAAPNAATEDTDREKGHYGFHHCGRRNLFLIGGAGQALAMLVAMACLIPDTLVTAGEHVFGVQSAALTAFAIIPGPGRSQCD